MKLDLTPTNTINDFTDSHGRLRAGSPKPGERQAAAGLTCGTHLQSAAPARESWERPLDGAGEPAAGKPLCLRPGRGTWRRTQRPSSGRPGAGRPTAGRRPVPRSAAASRTCSESTCGAWWPTSTVRLPRGPPAGIAHRPRQLQVSPSLRLSTRARCGRDGGVTAAEQPVHF